MVELREFFEEKKKRGRAVVDYESLLQAVPIGEENSLPFRNFRSKFNYRYSTLAAALEYLCLSGAVRRKKIKIKDYSQKVYGYWRELKENIEPKDEAYETFAKVFLSPSVQVAAERVLKEQKGGISLYRRVLSEMQLAWSSGHSKIWFEKNMSKTYEEFKKAMDNGIYMKGVRERTIETGKQKKHDLAALKEEVGKLEGRIAELEEETEYFRVSQKKNELEGRATALEKQLKKMQEEEWKVREDMK